MRERVEIGLDETKLHRLESYTVLRKYHSADESPNGADMSTDAWN